MTTVLPVLAYGFEAQFRIRDLEACFSGAKIRQTKTQLVAEYDVDKFAVAFDFGAVVFLNVSGEERSRVLAEIRAKVATDEPHNPLEEDYIVQLDPTLATHAQVGFERVMLRALSPGAVEIIARLLAQSVALDYYEEDWQEIQKALHEQTEHVASRGRLRGRKRDLTRFVASTLSSKNQMIAGLALLDKPAATWEDEALDTLYRALRSELEIEERARALEHKLNIIQDSLEIFLDIEQARHSHVLEIIIIALILFEVVMTVVDKLL